MSRSDPPSSGPTARKPGRAAVTDTGRVSPKPGTVATRTSGSRSNAAATTAVEEGERFSASVVVVLIFATTALSLYDLYLFLALLGR
jgi:hypothetical protein